MARVTVEDCVNVISNRFELVLLAAQRSRDIAAGVSMTVDRDNDKNTVVALREIAEQSIDFDQLRRHIAKGVNRHDDLNVEDDTLQAMTAETVLPFMDGDTGGEISEVEFDSGDEDAMDAADSDDDDAFNDDGEFAEMIEDMEMDMEAAAAEEDDAESEITA